MFKTKKDRHQDGSTRVNTMIRSDNNKDWVPAWRLGEPRDKANNIEILIYVKSVALTPITISDINLKQEYQMQGLMDIK